MSFSISHLLVDVETEFGMLKVNVNSVIAKVISGIELAAHEADALLKWGLSQAGTIEHGLTAAAPIISAVGALAATAATGNPAAGAAVSAAINGVNEAWGLAEKSVAAMNAANTAMQASKAQGTLVSDTTGLAAGIQELAGANAHVSALTNAALTAAKAIRAVTAPAPGTALGLAPAVTSVSAS